MDMPPKLQSALQEITQTHTLHTLAEHAQTVSDRYRFHPRTGDSLLSRPDEALAYALVRMPATFGAVTSALEQIIDRIHPTRIHSLLDVGAGTGAATWAAASFFPLQQITCLERTDVMRQTGQTLMEKAGLTPSPGWLQTDLTRGTITVSADLVIASYVLNELPENNRIDALARLWQAAKDTLLIVEPGTPQGYRQIMQYRTFLLKNGGFLIAPCPHAQACPLSTDDWCHFSCRLARTKQHRRIKQAELGYEDEKFCYLAVSKSPVSAGAGRILRPIESHPRHIRLTLCRPDGQKVRMTVSKKETALYKKAKKAKWGSSF